MAESDIEASAVCAVILAGGRATRMGGVDKGLQSFQGRMLVVNAMDRLRRQTLGTPGLIAINANRNLESYAALGSPVWRDTVPDFAGPLAGFLCAMQQCRRDYSYLLGVPCDTPRFPLDLLARLAQALQSQQADVAMAMGPDVQVDGSIVMRPQPVFCLMRTNQVDGLHAFLSEGGRKVGAWTTSLRQVRVPFDAPHDDVRAFANANTLEELHDLENP